MNTKNTKDLFLLFFLLTFSTCISPVDYDPEEPDPILIVDGFISDQDDEFTVTIKSLARYTSALAGSKVNIIRDADVFVTDQDGVITPFYNQIEVKKELYNPCAGEGCCPTTITTEIISAGYVPNPDFKAKIGNTYTLNIITYNGRFYQSTPQTLIEGPDLDSVSYKFRQLSSVDPTNFQSGVEILAHWTDPVAQQNFYSWRINGIYKIETPERPGANTCCLFDPSDRDATDICWIYETNIPGNELVFSDLQSNGNTISRRVGFIEDDGLRFSSDETGVGKQYYFEVEQLAMSAEAYEFHKLLASQISIDGDIFDPPPAEIRGNIRNVDDPDELVIGFFGAYSIKKGHKFIRRSDLTYIQRYPSLCGDCRNMAGARVKVPDVFR